MILVVRGGSSDNACWWSSTDGNDLRTIAFNIDMGVADCFSQKCVPSMLRVEPLDLRL